MQVTPIKTPIVHVGDDLSAVILTTLKKSAKKLQEKSVLAVTSKIVALCEGRVERKMPEHDKSFKHDLVRKEAEKYIEPDGSAYNMMLTIKDSVLAVNAGLDESNADSYYVYLPKDSYRSAEQIWQLLRSELGLKEFGVVITDSKTFPLKWGTMGTALAYCGFLPVNDRRGVKDLFGYTMRVTQINVAEGLAAAAVLEMGETDEAQPLAIIEDAQMIQFQERPPTEEEIDLMRISLDEDVYAPILTKAAWQPGKKAKK